MTFGLRPLGRSGLQVSAAAFGCARLGGTVERFDKAEARRVLERALAAGINFFDTADIYAQGGSERLLAEVFASVRDRIVLATKGGYRFSAAAGFLARFKPLIRRVLALRPGLAKSIHKARGSQLSQDFSTAALTAALDASLRRLRTGHVDLYYLHSPSADVLREGSVFTTLRGFQESGKIRAYGVSCLTPGDALLCRGSGVAAVQIELNLLTPASHAVLAPLAADGIAVIARQPLAAGRLTRAPESWTEDEFHGDPVALERARCAVSALGSPAEVKQLALRSLLARSGVTSVLFATTQLAHLDEDLRALNAPPLTPAELASLDATLAPLSTSGV